MSPGIGHCFIPLPTLDSDPVKAMGLGPAWGR